MTKAAGEQRRHPRLVASGKASLGWTDPSGLSRAMQGKCLDVSDGGMRVQLSDEVAVGTTVYVRAPSLSLEGSALVRHCRRKGLTFLVGLEFAGAPHKLKAPSG